MRRARPTGRTRLGAIVLTSLLAFLVPTAAASGDAATSTAVEPVVGPELPVGHPVPATPHLGHDPAIASGGAVHVVVWQAFGGGIRLARIDRWGAVMDTPGVLVTDGGEPGWNPTVAFDGVNFMVAWLDQDTVRAKRVSPAGEVLDPTSIQLSATPPTLPTLQNPAIAFDGTNYLVIWTSISVPESQGDVFGTVVGPDGVVVGPTDVRLTNGPGLKDAPAIAFAGDHYLVVWADYPAPDLSVRGTLVTTSGVALDPAGFPIAASPMGQGGPVVTSLGPSFFVAWFTQGGDVHGTRVEADGTVLDPSGIPITTSRDAVRLGIGSDGTGVLVVYQATTGSGYVTRAVRVASNGRVLDPDPIPLPTLATDPGVAFGGDHYVVTGAANSPVQATRVTPGGAVLDPAGVVVSMGANQQSGHQVGFDGTDSFVVWSDDRRDGDGAGIYGARVGPDGQLPDGTGFPIATGATGLSTPSDVTLAFDGTNFLVVWGEVGEHAVRAALVSRTGVVLDRLDVSVAPDEVLTRPKVAFGDGAFLVTWSRLSPGELGPAFEIRGARVTPTGEVLDPAGLRLATGMVQQEPFDLAFGASEFMIVWQDDYREPGGIYGTRLTTDGTLPDPDGFPIATADGRQSRPHVAWNGVTYLVVWEDGYDFSWPPASDIYAARVDRTGLVLDPAGIPVSTAPGGQEAPTVAANGPFLVTWIDRRRDPAVTDLYASRLDADGTVGHPEGFTIATSIDLYRTRGAPVAAGGDEGDFVVAYQRMMADPPYGTNRAFIRHVHPK